MLALFLNSRPVTPHSTESPLIRCARDLALCLKQEAVLFFENGLTTDGQAINEIALAHFATVVQHYRREHPGNERRVGSVFVSVGEAQTPILFHCPVPANAVAVPLAVLYRQLTLCLQEVRSRAITQLGILAATTDLLHGPEFIGMLRALFRDTAVTITVYDPEAMPT
jgi:hypothetical protein